MSGAKSIGNLYGLLTANASQFIGEFDRADKAAGKLGNSVQGQMAKISHHLERAFSPAKLVHGALVAGFGFGTGAALVEKGVELIKVRLDARTTITISNIKKLEFWKKRYPKAEVIS
jgi:hypothetical protein